jgi:hypothetical protein
VIPGQRRSAVYWRCRATHTGPLDPRGFAATGRRWEGDGVNVGEYRDGCICRLRTCLDMLGVSRQLGLMPPVGSRTKRDGGCAAGHDEAAAGGPPELRPLMLRRCQACPATAHLREAPGFGE